MRAKSLPLCDKIRPLTYPLGGGVAFKGPRLSNWGDYIQRYILKEEDSWNFLSKLPIFRSGILPDYLASSDMDFDKIQFVQTKLFFENLTIYLRSISVHFENSHDESVLHRGGNFHLNGLKNPKNRHNVHLWKTLIPSMGFYRVGIFIHIYIYTYNYTAFTHPTMP